MKKIYITSAIIVLSSVLQVKAALNTISLPSDDDTCRALFLREMARKCNELSLETAYFENASGLTPRSRISVSDLTKIALASIKHPDLTRIWAEVESEIEIGGPNARKETLVHAYKKYMKTWDEFIKRYKFLGGKGGSVYYPKLNISARCHVLVTEVEGQQILITFAGALYHDDALVYDVEILKLAQAMLRGEKPVLEGKLKEFEEKGGAFEFLTLSGKKIHFRSKYVDVPHVPASTTKILAALCMLDYIKDLSDKLTVRQSDIVGGSGFKCYAGDELTYEDALRALMLPSSNTIANSIASNIGAMLLEKRNQKLAE
jgi:D-alanyl-D-alanine carboxypeptidase